MTGLQKVFQMIHVIVVLAPEPEDIRMHKVGGVQTPAKPGALQIEFFIHIDSEDMQQALDEPTLAAMVW
jgi:hypothetical protein